MAEKKLLMDEYILTTSEQALKNIQNSYKLTKELVDLYLQSNCKSICIVASGSSSNGSTAAKDFMRRYLGVSVEIMPPFTFTHYNHDLVENSFTVVVSQSGISTNCIDALKKLRELGKTAIGITANVKNDFKDYADIEIDYGVVEEKEPYVTKGVTLLAVFFMLFSLEAGKRTGYITEEIYQEKKEQLIGAFTAYETVLEKLPKFIDKHIKAFSSMQKVFMCAAGGAYGAVCEGALKCSELLKVIAVPLETEEYIHGYNLQLTPHHTVFFLDTEQKTSERVRKIYEATCKMTDAAYMLTSFDGLGEDENVITIATKVEQSISSIYCLPFFQFLVYDITVYLDSLEQHPLLKEFNKVVSSKSDKYDKDYIRRMNCEFEQ